MLYGVLTVIGVIVVGLLAGFAEKPEEPVIGGGAGGDEPAGPWPIKG